MMCVCLCVEIWVVYVNYYVDFWCFVKYVCVVWVVVVGVCVVV